MRTTIVALCLIGATFAAQGTPLATSFCQGNQDGNALCSTCHNSNTNARVKGTDNLCTAVNANLVTDCAYFSNALTTTRTESDCQQCDSKDWLSVTVVATVPTILCSDTAAVTATCSTTVTNCDQSLCYTNTTTTVGCMLCKSGYTGTGAAVGPGLTSCATTTIANCDIGRGTDCFKCNSGYAVTSTTNTTCTAYTGDSNCRKLGTGNAYCAECHWGYIFNLLVCESSAKLMAFSGLMMALFFFN